MTKPFVGVVSAITLSAVGALLPAADAASLTLGSAKDSTLYDESTGALANGGGAGMFVGNTGETRTTRGILAFDVSSIPAGSVITGATLRLTMNQGPSSAASVTLHRVLANWSEGSVVASGGGGGGGPSTAGSVTWLHTSFSDQFWSTPGGDFNAVASATTSVAGAGTYTFTSAQLIADVQAWLDSGQSFGWIVRGIESGQGTAKRFATRESTTAASRPALEITYEIPAPGAALVAAPLALAARRRRR